MDMLELIKSRRSTRKFLSRPVEEEKIDAIIEAGRYAPSGGNNQSCHFGVVEDGEKLNELAELVQREFSGMEYDAHTYASLVTSIQRSKQGNYTFHYHAPLLIIVTNQKGYGNAVADSACAIENMMLMANGLDLGSCWINQLRWLDENAALRTFLKNFQIGEAETLCGSVAIGYADTEDGLPPRTPLRRKGNLVTWIR